MSSVLGARAAHNKEVTMETSGNCDIAFKYRGADVRFRLKPSPDYISDCMRRDSFFFDYRHMYEALRDVPRDASVVDVGAHIGSMSVWFARVAGARRVVAIEPDDEHYGMLVDNISLNELSDLVTPVHAAVGATCGRATCQFRASFTAKNMYRVADAGPVAAVTLDSLVEQGVITDAAVLKIDVEGYECAVLEGASLFFERFSPIILVEVWPPGRKTIDPNFDVIGNNRRFFGLAAALGYRVARTYQSNEDYLLVRESPKSARVLQPASAHRHQDEAHTPGANGTDMPTGPVTAGDRSAAKEVPAASGLSRACAGGSEASAAPRPTVGGFGFGGVYAVCFTGNAQRHDALMKELARVGIDSVQVVWGFPSPYRGFLLSHIPHVPLLDSRPGAWGATIAQYEAIKVAYERGQDRILVVEDDARFLVDVAKVACMLRDAPPDWDVLMLDHFSESYVTPVPASGWAEVNSANSSACYVLRRKAMGRLIDMYEGPVSGKYAHPVMRASDTFLSRAYLGRDVKIYCAIPNLAIQQECGDVSTCGHFPMLQYARAGLDISAYAPFRSA